VNVVGLVVTIFFRSVEGKLRYIDFVGMIEKRSKASIWVSLRSWLAGEYFKLGVLIKLIIQSTQNTNIFITYIDNIHINCSSSY